MLVVEARRAIRASRDHVFAYLARPEHLPRFTAPFWLSADPDDRRGSPHVTLRGYFAGLPVESVARVTVRSPETVELEQVRGTLRAFSQDFTLTPGEDGTEVLCRVEADLAIPVFSEEAARQFLIQYAERMLDRLKLAAERKTPGRRPPRGPASAPAGRASEAAAEPSGEAAAVEKGIDEAAADEAASDEAAAAAREPGALGDAGAEAARADHAAPEDAGETPRPSRPPAATGPSPGAPAGGRRRRRRRRRGGGRGPGGTPPGGSRPAAPPFTD